MFTVFAEVVTEVGLVSQVRQPLAAKLRQGVGDGVDGLAEDGEMFGDPVVGAAAWMYGAREHDLLLTRPALDLADDLPAPCQLRRQVGLPGDVVVQFAAPGDGPREAGLAEGVDHVAPL